MRSFQNCQSRKKQITRPLTMSFIAATRCVSRILAVMCSSFLIYWAILGLGSWGVGPIKSFTSRHRFLVQEEGETENESTAEDRSTYRTPVLYAPTPRRSKTNDLEAVTERLTTLLDNLTFSQQSEYEKRIAELELKTFSLKRTILSLTDENKELQMSLLSTQR